MAKGRQLSIRARLTLIFVIAITIILTFTGVALVNLVHRSLLKQATNQIVARLLAFCSDQIVQVHRKLENLLAGILEALWIASSVEQRVRPLAEDGWSEAVVTGKTGEMLTLRWRDSPRFKPFTRHVAAVALLNPTHK